MTDKDKSISTPIKSGEKYITEQGFKAIKDGVRSPRQAKNKVLKKPKWLNVKLSTSKAYADVKQLVNKNKLSTVCEEAKCPNISECWSHGTATIMLMGAVCTRACRFCSVDTGNPKGWLDKQEPANSADAVKQMNLKYIVLTSVDRDDVFDGGATHYAECIEAIRQACPETKIEALTPDFQGKQDWINNLLQSPPDVFAQNLETVKRLTHPVRDPKAGYETTLDELLYVKEKMPNILTKSSLMLGLGETMDEVCEAMDDLRRAKVDILTLY